MRTVHALTIVWLGAAGCSGSGAQVVEAPTESVPTSCWSDAGCGAGQVCNTWDYCDEQAGAELSAGTMLAQIDERASSCRGRCVAAPRAAGGGSGHDDEQPRARPSSAASATTGPESCKSLHTIYHGWRVAPESLAAGPFVGRGAPATLTLKGADSCRAVRDLRSNALRYHCRWQSSAPLSSLWPPRAAGRQVDGIFDELRTLVRGCHAGLSVGSERFDEALSSVQSVWRSSSDGDHQIVVRLNNASFTHPSSVEFILDPSWDDMIL